MILLDSVLVRVIQRNRTNRMYMSQYVCIVTGGKEREGGGREREREIFKELVNIIVESW